MNSWAFASYLMKLKVALPIETPGCLCLFVIGTEDTLLGNMPPQILCIRMWNVLHLLCSFAEALSRETSYLAWCLSIGASLGTTAGTTEEIAEIILSQGVTVNLWTSQWDALIPHQAVFMCKPQIPLLSRSFMRPILSFSLTSLCFPFDFSFTLKESSWSSRW